jgi:hypothetical protein
MSGQNIIHDSKTLNKNIDWSNQKEPDRAIAYELDFEEIVRYSDWGEEEYHYYCSNSLNDEIHYHVAMWLEYQGAKHGDLVLSPSIWWENVDDISNVYRIYTVKQGVPTVERIGSDIASYLNEDGWVKEEPIIGFSSPNIKYSLGPKYPVGYWADVPQTQDQCGGDGDFLRLEPVAAKNLYIDLKNPVDITIDDLIYKDDFSTLNLEWGGLQFPGEPKDVVRQLILYHKYEKYLREKPKIVTETACHNISHIRLIAGLKKPETLVNYGLNNSYHTEGRIIFKYIGKTKLGQPIARVLRLSDLGYHNTTRLSVWDEVVTIDNAMESLKHQLVELDTRWTIDKLEDISYMELYIMVTEHPTNFSKRLDKFGFE